MHGATYSGGADGKGMIQEDSNYEYGSGCEINAFDYYVDPSSLKEVVTTDGTVPAGTEKETKDPKGSKKGYFFHFNYIKGNELVFGMRNGIIYKYNKNGVFATIPISIFK